MGEFSDYLHDLKSCVARYAIKEPCCNPKVSIIVPAYNVEHYIEKCLFSLIRQTLKDIEIIVIDDGSIDNTYSIACTFKDEDKRIKVIQQENAGPSKARNEGLKLAKGEYISFIDADDWIDNDFIKKLYDAAKTSDSDIAAATIIRKREKSQKYRVHYTEEKVYETLDDKIKICNIPTCCYVWNKLYKKELLNDTFFEEGRLFEDVLWLPEIIKKANKLVTVPNTNYYYWVNNNSIVKKFPSATKQKDSYIAKKYIKKFFEENNLYLSKKQKTFTKRIIHCGNIQILKIKEYENWEIYYLLGFLPLLKIADSENRICYNIIGIRFSKKKIKSLKKN